MGLLGLYPQGDPFPAFCRAYAACVKAWGDDPAYKDYKFQIDQAMRGLALLDASPGMRSAYERPPTNPAGQDGARKTEAPSYAQTSEEESYASRS